jgi:hypothetical protein
MGNINVSWMNEDKTVIRYHFQKGWSWEEIDSAFKQAYDMLDTVTYKVDVIMDFADSSLFFPKNTFVHARRILANKPHANVRRTVLVGNSFINKMGDMVQKIVPKGMNNWDVLFAQTLEQGQAILEQRKTEEVDS